MSTKLKNAISWSIFLFGLGIVLAMFIAFIVIMLKPTFFPKVDISGIEDAFVSASALVGFFSVILGFYSIWQSSNSNKQIEKILQGIDIVKSYQEAAQHQSASKRNSDFAPANPDDPNKWSPDKMNN